MARCEHLPIYKAALDMTVQFKRVVAGFSRYHKYTLGTELREGSRAVLKQVLRANNAATRESRGGESAGRIVQRAPMARGAVAKPCGLVCDGGGS